MSNRVYLKFVWRLLALTVLVYSCVFIHFKGDDRVILDNGATISDLIYYNALKISMFTASLAFACLCEAFGARSLRYIAYTIASLMFWRMCFHIWMYNQIGYIEICFCVASLVAIGLRALYTSKSFNTWFHLKSP